MITSSKKGFGYGGQNSFNMYLPCYILFGPTGYKICRLKYIR